MNMTYCNYYVNIRIFTAVDVILRLQGEGYEWHFTLKTSNRL